MTAVVSDTLTCGQAAGGRSRATGHLCGRAPGHDFDDQLGHICRCQAERFLERHAPCSPPRRIGATA